MLHNNLYKHVKETSVMTIVECLALHLADVWKLCTTVWFYLNINRTQNWKGASTAHVPQLHYNGSFGTKRIVIEIPDSKLLFRSAAQENTTDKAAWDTQVR